MDGLTWMPAKEIRDLIASKEVSPVEVVDHFLSRIEELEPRLHAFNKVDHGAARAQAVIAERAVRDGAALGPLHGLPTAVMDLLMVKGFRNPLWQIDPPYDDLGVERLRNAGAIIIG